MYSLGADRFTLSRVQGEDYELQHHGPKKFKLRRNIGRSGPLPAPEKFYRFQLSGKYQNAGFLADLELALESVMDNLSYLGPLREYPQRQYTWGGSEPSDVGRRGERAIEALLSAKRAETMISRGPGRPMLTVEQYVAYWLKTLGVIHDFSITELNGSLYQVRVQRSEGSAEVALTDVGFGVSQLLPVLVLCYFAPEGSTLVLEQPEIHLHPSVQAGLADVFIDAIQKRGLQIVIESHSEYLLKRLQRRIAETEKPYEAFTEDDVALYFCTQNQGASKAEELEVDTYGNIVNWPQDFFGDEMEDLAARTRAAARRKMASG
jgi:predicted ATPase